MTFTVKSLGCDGALPRDKFLVAAGMNESVASSNLRVFTTVEIDCLKILVRSGLL